MCLLVTQPEGTVFDDHFLQGVYRHNSDGIGVMLSENNSVVVRRYLPKTEKDFIKFFKANIEGRKCSWHARMRTHGDIDLDNCHPYVVLTEEDGYPLYLAHNGVLHTGNKADLTKSDTWHYIQNYLRPMLLKNPEFFMHPSFADIVGEHIGNNRFSLMDAYGNLVVVNQNQGVRYNGAWLSNTYAWDTTGTEHDFSYRRGNKYGGYGSHAGRFSLYDDDDDLINDPVGGQQGEEKENQQVLPTEREEVDEQSLQMSWCAELFDVLQDFGFDNAIDALHWDDVESYYQTAGVGLAYDFLDALYYGSYTEEEVMNEILGLSALPFVFSEEHHHEHAK